MDFASHLNLKNKSYKESWSTVAFYGKVNIRRKLRPRSAKFGSLIDFDHDFPSAVVPAVVPASAGSDECDLERLSALTSLALVSQQEDPGQLLKELQFFFLNDGILHRKHVYRILALAEEYYRSPGCQSLVEVDLPDKAVINICGDIHGQFYDLIKIFKLRGPPTNRNLYLFNGDIVDKGAKSLECILLLFMYKLTFPDYVFLNRGNHESATVNAKHGFQKEIARKYAAAGGGGGGAGDHFMFEFFGEIFRWMPIAHLISSKILVVHGGISGAPNLTLDAIRNVK